MWWQDSEDGPKGIALVIRCRARTFRLLRRRPPEARKDLKEIGWTKGRELAKRARAEGQDFDCAPWAHKARSIRGKSSRERSKKN